MHAIIQKAWLMTMFVAVTGFGIIAAYASESQAPDQEKTAKVKVEGEKKETSMPEAIKALAAALAIGIAAIATARAQAVIGAAGIGAIAENPKNFGSALIFLALPETLLIFGFTIAAIILFIV